MASKWFPLGSSSSEDEDPFLSPRPSPEKRPSEGDRHPSPEKRPREGDGNVIVVPAPLCANQSCPNVAALGQLLCKGCQRRADTDATSAAMREALRRAADSDTESDDAANSDLEKIAGSSLPAAPVLLTDRKPKTVGCQYPTDPADPTLMCGRHVYLKRRFCFAHCEIYDKSKCGHPTCTTKPEPPKEFCSKHSRPAKAPRAMAEKPPCAYTSDKISQCPRPSASGSQYCAKHDKMVSKQRLRCDAANIDEDGVLYRCTNDAVDAVSGICSGGHDFAEKEGSALCPYRSKGVACTRFVHDQYEFYCKKHKDVQCSKTFGARARDDVGKKCPLAIGVSGESRLRFEFCDYHTKVELRKRAGEGGGVSDDDLDGFDGSAYRILDYGTETESESGDDLPDDSPDGYGPETLALSNPGDPVDPAVCSYRTLVGAAKFAGAIHQCTMKLQPSDRYGRCGRHDFTPDAPAGDADTRCEFPDFDMTDPLNPKRMFCRRPRVVDAGAVAVDTNALAATSDNDDDDDDDDDDNGFIDDGENFGLTYCAWHKKDFDVARAIEDGDESEIESEDAAEAEVSDEDDNPKMHEGENVARAIRDGVDESEGAAGAGIYGEGEDAPAASGDATERMAVPPKRRINPTVVSKPTPGAVDQTKAEDAMKGIRGNAPDHIRFIALRTAAKADEPYLGSGTKCAEFGGCKSKAIYQFPPAGTGYIGPHVEYCRLHFEINTAIEARTRTNYEWFRDQVVRYQAQTSAGKPICSFVRAKDNAHCTMPVTYRTGRCKHHNRCKAEITDIFGDPIKCGELVVANTDFCKIHPLGRRT